MSKNLHFFDFLQIIFSFFQSNKKADASPNLEKHLHEELFV
ncbi:hypothetical protein HMPREF9443_01761 [Phascolarctobacterium succinatutens YIT 12067]|uniref:Uncharacterized protein n=1 Tax=Phascolarctobacterium succinatutens YIT 12067 TaxID=626939 RepID=E8LFW8_9FIRM|nr:hypothetical protein HMPREF9443_01761 [Phascolarctobacterium succinatutens YIT 12067]